MKRRAAVLALGAALAPGAARAQADAYEKHAYMLCNETSYVLDAAIAEDSGASVTSRGWFRILPGSCTTAPANIPPEEPAYVHARSVDAYADGTRHFAGMTRFCIGPEDEDFVMDGLGVCRDRSLGSLGFTEISSTADGRKTTFAEPAGYAPRRARVAGVQRLLGENGFDVSSIDGLAGNETHRLILRFQRTHGLKATGTISAVLYEALAAAARRKRNALGLNLCNRSAHAVWAAIGHEGAEGFESRGWFHIPREVCAKAIKGPLTRSAYYAFAAAVDESGAEIMHDGKPLTWGGAAVVCTKNTRFLLRGREACLSRGLDAQGFRRVDTAGQDTLTVTIE